MSNNRNNRNNSSNIANLLNNNTSAFIPPSSPRNATFTIDDDDEIFDDINNDDNIILNDENIILNNENIALKHTIEYMLRNYPKKEICKKIFNNKCPICLEEFKFSDKLIFTSCYHVFHKYCIDESIEKGNNTCPKCRFSMEHSGFMNIELKLDIKNIEFN